MRKRFFLALITAIILVVVVIAVYFILSAEPQDGSSPLITIDLEYGAPPRDGNITQGMAFTMDLTISSFADKELTIPLSLSLKALENVGWLPPLTEETVFNSTFVPSQLVLQPHGTSSSILVVHLAEDAPLGTYVFHVKLGNSEETNVEGTSFLVDVSPK
jgi:hypothetical protein